jgi:uncharacterized OB-fold protein
MRTGLVYTETVVHLAPERFADDVPYQVIIVSLDTVVQSADGQGGKITARVEGERVAIDDRVIGTDSRDGIPYFRKL